MSTMLVGFVDDARTNLFIYEKIVSRLPEVTSHSFDSSLRALEWCAAVEPDLLVVDYKMPAPNGLEFIEHYRNARPGSTTPIVMITNESDRDVRHKALELGASDFLNKPIDPIELLARVRNLLALRQSQHKLADHAAWLAHEVDLATAEISAREVETIHRLMRAAEFRDNETGMHLVRLGHYSKAIAAELRLGAKIERGLLLAAPMHDIGKVSTPDTVLLKRGPLDAAEWEIMRRHTTAGHDILKDSKSEVLQLAAEIAHTHHEKFDGTGYPRQLRGAQIPLGGRICSIADVFDALTSVRPYKPAWPVDDAMALIRRKSGTHFDPVLVSTFEKIQPEIEAIRNRFGDETNETPGA
ncbi:MAG: two-component system response regulator [Candidatus Velthaea sp.]